MPMLDMPLEELRVYTGINPKPDDYDAYWDRALQEMAAVDAEVELKPASFQAPGAECFHLYFTGVRGARVHAKFVRPKRIDSPCPAVLQFHGYTLDSGEWHAKLAHVAIGQCVAALDCRGQGGLSQDVGGVKGNTHQGHIIRGLADDPDNLLYRQIFLDTAQLARIVMDMAEVDEQRVGAMGASQGGALTLACAALEPRVRKAAAMYPFLCDYRRVWEMDMTGSAYAELRTFFKRHDPTHARADQWFGRLGYIDVQHLAPRIRAEVLMGVGLMDEVCPPSSQFAAYNRITSKKQMVVYPDFGHEGLPGFFDRGFTMLAEL